MPMVAAPTLAYITDGASWRSKTEHVALSMEMALSAKCGNPQPSIEIGGFSLEKFQVALCPVLN
jgi:hypothetical protein